jgi:hypothetical protein
MESLDELISGAETQRAVEEMELMTENAAAALDAAGESTSTTPVGISTPRTPTQGPEAAAEDPWDEDPVGEMVGAVGDVVAGALEAVASPMTMVMGSCMLSSADGEGATLAVDDNGVQGDATGAGSSQASSAVPTPRSTVPYYRAPRPGSNLTDSPHLFLANTGPAVGVPIATVRRRSRGYPIAYPNLPPARPTCLDGDATPLQEWVPAARVGVTRWLDSERRMHTQTLSETQ